MSTTSQPTQKQAAILAAHERIKASGERPTHARIAAEAGCSRPQVIRTLRKYKLAQDRPLTPLQARIVAYRDEYEAEHGRAPTQTETAAACQCSMQTVFETLQRTGRKSRGAGRPARALELFDRKPSAGRTWLVEGVLAAGETCVLGGPAKSLKTSLAIDLAVSIAAGVPFLGEYPIGTRGCVLFIAGESSPATLRESVRVVAASRGLPGDVAGVHFLHQLPTISDDGSSATIGGYNLAEAVGAFQRAEGLAVVVLDPFYLLGNRSARCIQTIAEAVAPATLVVVHHAKPALKPGRSMQLDDLQGSTAAEVARQWLLINRRTAFDPSAGTVHHLVMQYGGAAGHAGAISLDVDVGKWNGRQWSVFTRDETKR